MTAGTDRRDWIIHSLVQYQMEKISRGGYGLWLLTVLESGFQGFRNMSDAQLEMELRQRGLRAEFEVPEAPVDEEDADDDDDDEWRDAIPVPAVDDTYAA